MERSGRPAGPSCIAANGADPVAAGGLGLKARLIGHKEQGHPFQALVGRGRNADLIDLVKRTPAAFFGQAPTARQRAGWSWDSLDLTWEAVVWAAGAPVYVLAFPAGFDVAPIVAHFTDCGFSETRRGSARVFSSAGIDFLGAAPIMYANDRLGYAACP